jgi:hypothetical protein
MLDALAAVYRDGAPAERAQSGHAARITRRAASLCKAIVETQAAYEQAIRRAAGEAPAVPEPVTDAPAARAVRI